MSDLITKAEEYIQTFDKNELLRKEIEERVHEIFNLNPYVFTKNLIGYTKMGLEKAPSIKTISLATNKENQIYLRIDIVGIINGKEEELGSGYVAINQIFFDGLLESLKEKDKLIETRRENIENMTRATYEMYYNFYPFDFKRNIA